MKRILQALTKTSLGAVFPSLTKIITKRFMQIANYFCLSSVLFFLSIVVDIILYIYIYFRIYSIAVVSRPTSKEKGKNETFSKGEN